MTTTLAIIISIPIVFFGSFYIAQDSMLFHPTPHSEERYSYIKKTFPMAKEITITPRENNTGKESLHGWLRPCETNTEKADIKNCPVIIYFGGNAEDVSWMLGETGYLDNYSIALINYRGYGLSTGTPSEKTMYSDAVSVYTYMVSRSDIDSERVVVMGRSIGTGVAVSLASYLESAKNKNASAQGVILVSPYDSLVKVAGKLYRYLPVGLIMRHRFEVIELASGIKAPMLAIVAENDKIIPLENSLKLIDAWGGETSTQIIEDRGHNDSHTSESYRDSIKFFLAQIN